MSNPDSTFSREKIISEVFNDEFEGFDRTVDTHMANLRKKISTADKGNNYFHTIYGSGYRFGTK
jgi:DNA-binding response OmpR family regulator